MGRNGVGCAGRRRVGDGQAGGWGQDAEVAGGRDGNRGRDRFGSGSGRGLGRGVRGIVLRVIGRGFGRGGDGGLLLRLVHVALLGRGLLGRCDCRGWRRGGFDGGDLLLAV